MSKASGFTAAVRAQATPQIAWARFSTTPPPFLGVAPTRGAFRRGLLYEEDVQQMLEPRFNTREAMCYISCPWIRFATRREPRQRWAQPDGILLDMGAGEITIVEIKYSHTELAFHKLLDLYLPLARCLFSSDWSFKILEIVKQVDVALRSPMRLCPQIEDAAPGALNVHVWNPGRALGLE